MEKQIITFSANEQTLTKTGGVDCYASNTVAYIEARFELGDNWSGYDSVRAVWFTDFVSGISTVLDSDGVCIVPYEVLTRKGEVTINLVGSISNGEELTDRLTTCPVVALTIKCNAQAVGTETAAVTPSQFEQFVDIVKADADRAETVRDEAEAARDVAVSAKDTAVNAVEGFEDIVDTATATAVQTIQGEGATQVTAIQTEGTTQVASVRTEGSTQVTAVQDKGDEVLDSIPADYTQLSQNVTDLKSDFNFSTGNNEIAITEKGKFINLAGSSVTMSGGVPQATASDPAFNYYLAPCSVGDKFTINGAGGNNGRLWGFVSSTGAILAAANALATADAIVLEAPQNSVYLIINNKTSDNRKSYYGESLASVVNTIDAEVFNLYEDYFAFDDEESIVVEKNKRYDYDSSTLQPTIGAYNYACTSVNVNGGDLLKIFGATVIANQGVCAFYDANDKKLGATILIASAGSFEKVIVAPHNAVVACITGYYDVIDNPTYPLVVKRPILKIADDVNANAVAISKVENQLVEVSEYVGLDVVLTRGFYSYSGSPSHKTFTSLDYYESASVNCAEGEKYSISGYVLNSTSDIGFFWDENDNLISSIGTSDVNEYSNKLIEIPDGCVNFTVTSYRNGSRTYTNIKKWLVVGAESEKEKHPLSGKKFISFGDSITAFAPRWRDEFLRQTGAEEIHCYAVGGATLVDWEDTVLDGNITDGAQNTVCNQVAQFLLDPPEDIPDFVVISAGTNDSWSADDLTRTTNTQFVNDSNQWISLDDVDRMRPDGAMRWQAEKIWSVYPNTVIVFGAPIQCAESIHRFRLQQQKNDRMKIVGNQLSCKVIMGAYDSGIYGRYETANVNGKYLADGIHPNTAGGIVLGKLYAREICNLLKF